MIVNPYLGTGGGGGGGARLFLGLVETSVVYADTWITIHSDTELKSTLTISDLTVSNNVTGMEYVDSLTFKLTLSSLTIGDTITVRVGSSGYRNNNGDSEVLTLTVMDYSPASLLNTTKGMTIVRNNVKVDSGSDTCTMTKSYPGVLSYPRNACNTFVLDANEFVTVNNLGQTANVININQRDGAMSYTWKQEGTMQGVDFVKLRWKGSAHYKTDPDTEWEIIFLSNGDIYLNLIQQGATWTGTFTLFGLPYTVNTANPLVAFYRNNYLNADFDIVHELYNFSHHKAIADNLFNNFALADVYLDYENNVAKYRNNSKNDDGTDIIQLGLTWRYNGADCTSVYVSGNSFIGLGSAAENIKMNRRDAASYYVFTRYAILTDQGNLKGVQFIWRGASAYNGSIDQWWSCWLFENGDGMIHIKQIGSYTDGTSSFCGASYTKAVDAIFSFYRNDAEGTSWTIENVLYDVTHHRI